MKKLYTIILFVIIAFNTKGQVNLVTNPSFELNDTCPNYVGQISRAIGWSVYRDHTPDYFNPCAVGTLVSAPTSAFGYQQAATGIAYAGLITFCRWIPDYREIIGSQLSTALSPGIKYFTSFKVALSLDTVAAFTNFATNKIGINFSTIPYYDNYPDPLPNSAKVNCSSFITDSLNWTIIFGSFIADSAYQYIMVGNFFDDLHTDTLSYFYSGVDQAYYFIDDICLSTDSLEAYNYGDSGGHLNIAKNILNEDLTIFPNPFTSLTTITFSDEQKNTTIKITDLLGKEIKTINFTGRQLLIEKGEMKAGIYFVQTTDEKKNVTNKKIIIQ